ncbi:hypothetical protein EG329_008634 [Mollisiaceae sp. DMI_Dod_QoI]|nr:hypothetical protein EG329_008634 [Helotiales sp. DMI_Dod_QoI]
MLFSNLLLILGLGKPAYGSVAPPPIPTTCPIGKICPWGWGEIYTIYENQPNLIVQRQYNDGIYFEASQKVDRCRDKDKSSKPYDRVYTLMHLQFSGLGTQGCSLDFNIPCNSTIPFYPWNHPVVAARALTAFPGNSPTWNNIQPLISSPILGTFHEPFKRDTFEEVASEVCRGGLNGGFNELAFVWSIDESVKESSGLKFNITLMNSDIVVGPYVNFTC